MKRNLKKPIAIALAVLLSLSFAGCNLYNENNLWAAKKGDTTLSIGGYIYYVNNALSEAAGKVSTETEILKATIEDKKAEDWILDKAKESVQTYFFVNERFNELGLELSDEDKETIESNTAYMWSYYSTSFEAAGISRDSFNNVYSEYTQKYQKIFEKLYGPGGEREVTDDELTTYYEDSYFNYEYFTAPTTELNEEGESEAVDDEKKEEIKKELEEYKKKLEDGETTMGEAANEYQTLHVLESSTYNTSTPKIENASGDVQEAVLALGDNEIAIIETDSNYTIAKRLPIADTTQELLEDETSRFGLISEIKSEEFSDYVKEEAKKVTDIEYNNNALNTVRLSGMVNDDSKMGTSSVAEESSDVSSNAESEDGSEVPNTESDAGSDVSSESSLASDGSDVSSEVSAS